MKLQLFICVVLAMLCLAKLAHSSALTCGSNDECIAREGEDSQCCCAVKNHVDKCVRPVVCLILGGRCGGEYEDLHKHLGIGGTK